MTDINSFITEAPIISFEIQIFSDLLILKGNSDLHVSTSVQGTAEHQLRVIWHAWQQL